VKKRLIMLVLALCCTGCIKSLDGGFGWHGNAEFETPLGPGEVELRIRVGLGAEYDFHVTNKGVIIELEGPPAPFQAGLLY